MRVDSEFENCILCVERSADSWEHIIPDSLGGRVEVRLLCSCCNNTFGSKFVSVFRSDPSIRIALENLKDEIPNLYRSAQDALPFVGKAEDGSVIKASRKGNKWRILAGPGAQWSRIQDTRDARKALKRILTKMGLSDQEVNRWMELFDSLGEDIALVLPDGQTFVKLPTPALEPELTGKLVSDRVPALIAYEFLAFAIGDLIYQDDFDGIRQYIMRGIHSDRYTVQRLSSAKYAPAHAIYLQPEKTYLTVFVHLFRWLVFAIKFDRIGYRGDDAVYIEDLKKHRSLIATSRSDAREGKWYIF